MANANAITLSGKAARNRLPRLPIEKDLITAPRCTITATLGLAAKLLVPDEGERGTGRALRYALCSASARRPAPAMVTFLRSRAPTWSIPLSQILLPVSCVCPGSALWLPPDGVG